MTLRARISLVPQILLFQHRTSVLLQGCVQSSLMFLWARDIFFRSYLFEVSHHLEIMNTHISIHGILLSWPFINSTSRVSVGKVFPDSSFLLQFLKKSLNPIPSKLICKETGTSGSFHRQADHACSQLWVGVCLDSPEQKKMFYF